MKLNRIFHQDFSSASVLLKWKKMLYRSNMVNTSQQKRGIEDLFEYLRGS